MIIKTVKNRQKKHPSTVMSVVVAQFYHQRALCNFLLATGVWKATKTTIS